MRYHRSGDRQEHEQRLFARQHRLTRAVVAAAVSEDPALLDDVIDGAVAICEQSSWCWPAHDDAHQRRGHVLPDVDNPFLDLGAGEVAGQLAWLDHLVGAHLDERAPGLRQRIRAEVHRRVFAPFLQRRDWHWLGLQGPAHNWNPWIHQNVVTAAAALIDDQELRAEVIALAIAGLDNYLVDLPVDGAIDEGFHYWWNGACRAWETLAILDHATDGALDASSIASLRASVGFPAMLALGAHWCYSFSDSHARLDPGLPWHLLHRWARLVGHEGARRFALSQRPRTPPLADEREGLGRLVLGLLDRDWSDAEPVSLPVTGTHYVASTQILVGHRGDLSLAATGGHNGENHNHHDVGSVSVGLRGRPVLVDPGRVIYDARTFGAGRHRLWYVRSDWHNVPSVAGARQGTGAQFRAVDVEFRPEETASGGPSLRADLSELYPGPTRWQRTATLGLSEVRIRDVWSGPVPEQPHCLHWVIAGEPHDEAAGSVRVLTPAGSVELSWDEETAFPRWQTREPLDPMMRHSWGERLIRLTLTVRPDHLRAGELTLRVRPHRS